MSSGGSGNKLSTSMEAHNWNAEDNMIDATSVLGKVNHYWDFISTQLSHLETVKYVNFRYKQAQTHKEKALGWILLAVNSLDELKMAFSEIFSNPPIL
jgi:hypothetical protein